MVDERLLVGYDSSDDAAVYIASEEIAIIQTLDFFPPVVDDPYDFGRIAAANAISDVYAMGATPKIALNLLCFSNCLSLAVVRKILEGGADKCMEAGAIIAGGHSIEDEEVKYGLSVMGLCHPDKIRRNDTPRHGDVLVLTKPLGTGALSTGAKVDLIEPESERLMVETMAKLNKNACEASLALDVSASTDITGFGLMGHASEMAGNDNQTTLVFESQLIPFLPQAIEMAIDGILPAGAYRNRHFIGDRASFASDVPLEISDLVFDPQTSGGLLLAMREEDVEPYRDAMHALGEEAWRVGKVLPWEGAPIKVI